MDHDDEDDEGWNVCPGCREMIIHLTKILCDKCSKELDNGLNDLTRGGDE